MSAGICYLPVVLPDEVLYSYIARVAACNALGDPRARLQILFGTKDIIPCADFPTQLASLYHRLDGAALFSSIENLIETRTLYPYHRPFLVLERHDQALHVILQGHGKGLKTVLGRVANRFGASPPLRYCHICHREDVKHHGAPYWHRSHQLPGVTCCAIHCNDLRALEPFSKLSDRQQLLLPPGVPAPCTQEHSSAAQFQFSILSKNLLEAGLPAMDPLRRQAIYTDAAISMGFGTGRQRIDRPGLAKAIRQHYRDFEGFQHRNRLLSTPTHPMRWLDDLFERPCRSSHPVCHLLLIGFLFQSVEVFKHSVLESDSLAPRGVLLPCPGTSTANEAPIGEAQDTILRDTSRSCRAAAQALGLSVTTVVTRRRALKIPIAERRKYLRGPVLNAASAALARGQPPSTIAQQHGLSLSTVYRLRQATAIPPPSSNHTANTQKRDQQRARWTQAIDQYGYAGFRATRNQSAGAYIWLYRHDRDWLRKNGKLPLNLKKKPTSRIDWSARDRALCIRLEQCVTTLHRDPNRPRLSQSYFYRYLGATMLRHHLASLPKLQKLLEKHTESLLAFRCFRITRAVQQLVHEGRPPTLWRVQRLAGIKYFTDTMRVHAVREIQRMNSMPLHL